jgi:hypothetical protein
VVGGHARNAPFWQAQAALALAAFGLEVEAVFLIWPSL